MKAAKTSSQAPNLCKPHAAVLWFETHWTNDFIAFLFSKVTQKKKKKVLENCFSASKYAAACSLLNTAV